MSVDPVTKLSELDVARYRVIRLLMQSEDLAYLARLELQLVNVLDPERLALEGAGEVLPAASLALPKGTAEMTSEERLEQAKLEQRYKPASKKEWAEFADVFAHISEEEVRDFIDAD